MHYVETQYGFDWGSAKIKRWMCDEKKGWVIIGLETPKYVGHHATQIYVTKTGKVTICTKDKKIPL